MLTDKVYGDSPLVLAQQRLTEAAAVVAQLLADADSPAPCPVAESPVSARKEALRELVPRWHFAMLNDLDRNSLFQEAIENTVQPGDHVLDIGTGSGLLAMIAARRGAGTVTSCEFVRPVAKAAEQIVAGNGYDGVIRVFNKRSDELTPGKDLPEAADVIVTEIVDCGLVGEGIIPTLRHARENLLKPSGTIVPRAARLVAAPVDSAEIWKLNQVENACGFDVSHFNEFATARYFQVRLRSWPHRMLAEPSPLLAFDFLRDPLHPGEVHAEITMTRSGLCHGISFWFELDLDEQRTLTNDPARRSGHWLQAFQCFPEPIPVTAGQTLPLLVTHSDDLIHFTPAV